MASVRVDIDSRAFGGLEFTPPAIPEGTVTAPWQAADSVALQLEGIAAQLRKLYPFPGNAALKIQNDPY